MGVLIKGFQMPDDCLSCPLFNEFHLACVLTGNSMTRGFETGRMPDCPLSESHYADIDHPDVVYCGEEGDYKRYNIPIDEFEEVVF